MQIEIYGRIIEIFPTETVTATFKKRVIWVEEVEQNYANTYQIEFIQNKIEELNGFKAGDLVEVGADVQGRKAKVKGADAVFNTIKGWKIKRVGEAATTIPSTRQQTGGIPAPNNQTSNPDDDDLPF